MSTTTTTTLDGVSGDLYVTGQIFSSNVFVPTTGGGFQNLVSYTSGIGGNAAGSPVDTLSTQIVSGSKYFASSQFTTSLNAAGGIMTVGGNCSFNCYSLALFNNNQAGVAAASLQVYPPTSFSGTLNFAGTTIFNNVLGTGITNVATSTLNYNSGGIYTNPSNGSNLFTITNTAAYLTGGSTPASANSGTLYTWNNIKVNVSTNPLLYIPDPCAGLAGYTVNFVRTGGNWSAAAGANNGVLVQGNAVTIVNASYPANLNGTTQNNAFLNTIGTCLPNVVLGYSGASATAGIYWFKSGFVCVPNYDDSKYVVGGPTIYCWNQYFYQ